ncbi:unnamed protein product [Rotaria sp. Silwood2]|nr:unnamed protein product [Rotaria sp. Silwood2]
MPWLLASKRVIHLVTFETVVKNYPTVYIILHEFADPNICLALLCRKGACIEPKKSTHQNKSLIAAEHVSHVTRFFEQININPSTYHLDRVTGSSEGYLVNTDLYLLADAIVESYLTKTTNTHCTLWNGTDKNSYYDILENENIVLPNSNGEYLCGPYVRLDWRNPNHISPKTRKSLNENPYYYIYEQAVGKEEFFNKILANKSYAIPFGDKNITEDLVTHLIDVKQTKLSALKMFMIIQSYFSQVNLLIKDVCFMVDKNGEKFWSEVNQDCMRITAIDSNQNKFDKDIWRAGGSASREQILQKWNAFNRILIEYFMKNKFHQTELLTYNSYFYTDEIEKLLKNTQLRIPTNLQELWLTIRGKNPRSVLVTMDMFNGQPVLVKSSQVCEVHSDGEYGQAMEKLSIFPDILIVDLNGAFGETDTKNRQIIKKLAQKHHIYMGGGLRSLTDVEDMLKSSVRRCVVASADDVLITKIPKERLVVEISINEQNEVLIHGRQTNTHVNIITKINQLIQIDVNIISITFVQSEGHLSGIPRQQIRNLFIQNPQNIERI